MNWVKRVLGRGANDQRGANDPNKIPVDFPDTLRRLNYLIEHLKLESYLEIGLGNGGTFDSVAAQHKVGVDPHPWNPAVKDLPGVHIVTSDEYFTRHWHDAFKFDLILLDGLHTAEQTYRDFVNSLHYAHARTVWLIDDVAPTDVFSAMRDPAETIKHRKAAGSDNTAWHGDVYKVVWMIKTFHNNMRLRTFFPRQPQSLVYFDSSAGTPVSDATLNDVSGLTYDDTVSRRAEYNIGEEAKILKECVAALAHRAKHSTSSPA